MLNEIQKGFEVGLQRAGFNAFYQIVSDALKFCHSDYIKQ